MKQPLRLGFRTKPRSGVRGALAGLEGAVPSICGDVCSSWLAMGSLLTNFFTLVSDSCQFGCLILITLCKYLADDSGRDCRISRTTSASSASDGSNDMAMLSPVPARQRALCGRRRRRQQQQQQQQQQLGGGLRSRSGRVAGSPSRSGCMPPTGFGTRIRFKSKESLTPRHDTKDVKPY